MYQLRFTLICVINYKLFWGIYAPNERQVFIMKFKVLNAYKKGDVLLVTGIYSPEPDEKELLELMRQTLEEVNRTIDGRLQCNRFVANDKTILFKSIPIETVYAVLQLHNNSFDLHMRVVMGRNMRGHSLKPEVEQYFAVHKF